ncbi:erv26 super protein [Gnomoniopsis smithogilvyi]|uniref:Erv26 super protein n=1 Tax=Gnomoniopsis smithogilvyi TaxID=1191159 RepID=A0A9W9D0H3_9PEZI|nr:erv26 super protein [Gnomoniopsis smithogilvyi]
MWILPVIGIFGSILGFCFLTLAIASGLYYLSELVEEHTVVSKRLLTRLIYFIVALQVLLWLVDRFPFWLTMLGVASHVVYLGNMRRFPFVTLTDPLFIISCVLVLANHVVWYSHFSARQKNAYSNLSSYYDTPDGMPTFTEIASFFGICVWLVPFALFVSLSASDNVLPTENPTAATAVSGDGSKKRGQGLVKTLVDVVRNGLGEVAIMVGWKRRDDGF